FRQPSAPDSRVLVVDTPGESRAEICLAVRGLSRGDADSIAADLLALIIRNRWQSDVPELANAAVRHGAHLLPGAFILSGSLPTASASKAVTAAQQIMNALAQAAPTAAEINTARAELLSQISKQMSQPEGLANLWLDVDT